MLVVPLSLASALFALGGLLVWLAARLLGVRLSGRKVLRNTLVGWLVSVPLLMLVGAPLLLSGFVATHGTRPWERSLATTPGDLGRPYREVEFETSDGLRLRGWHLAGEPAAPTILLAHGLFRSRHEVLERACGLNQRGFSLLVFDLRNHGRSQQGITSLGYRERLDFLAARRFVKEEKGGGAGVVMMGVSMGAVAALQAGADLGGDLEAIVADSPFLSLTETAERHTRLMLGLPAFTFARVFIWNLTRLAGYQARELDNEAAAARLTGVPVLLIYGQEDRRMPPEVARGILKALPHAGRRLVFFEGAGHAAAYRTHPRRYLDLVEEFVKETGPARR